MKSAAVADNKLTLTKQDNTVVEFEGGGGGSYTLPVASTTTLGGVKPDGTTITIDNTGIISAQTDGAIYKRIPKWNLHDYLEKPENKAWVIDWANNPAKYIVEVYRDNNSYKVIYTYPDTLGRFNYYFYNEGNVFYYYIQFTDGNFTEISSDQPTFEDAGITILNENNWSSYITISGGGDWQNTTWTGNSDLYNAKEVVIFWQDTQSGFHQTYLNVGCDYYGNSGSTWGSSNWLNTDIYLDKWDEYNGAYINYDGNNVNASNCSINSICYKT